MSLELTLPLASGRKLVVLSWVNPPFEVSGLVPTRPPTGLEYPLLGVGHAWGCGGAGRDDGSGGSWMEARADLQSPVLLESF